MPLFGTVSPNHYAEAADSGFHKAQDSKGSGFLEAQDSEVQDSLKLRIPGFLIPSGFL